MMEKQQTRIAIAVSLLWMAMATVLILGTHGPAVAQADAALDAAEGAPVEAATAEWLALPARDAEAKVARYVTLRC